MADVSIIIATNAKEASRDISGLSASITNSAARANQLAKSFGFVDKAFNKGKIDAVQYSSIIQRLNKEESNLYSTLGKTTSALNTQASAMSRVAKTTSSAAIAAEALTKRQRMAGKSTNKFGMYSQQVGYQVGDFAVQVQSGTNALVAFGQQGTQLAGLLPGLTGAVLGIGLAIGTAVARSVLDAKKLEIDFKAVINELKKPLESIKPVMDAVSSAFKSTGGVAVSAISTIANNLDRVVLYITVAAAAFGTKLVAGLIAARVATFTLAGAFAFLRTAIIRTGIGAIIIGIAEAIRMFMLLSKQIGGVGPLLQLLKDAFFEVLDKVGLMFQWLGLMAKATFFGILKDSLEILSDLLSKVNSNFVNKFIGMFAGAIGAVAEYIKSLPDIFVAVFQMVKKAVADGVNSFTGIIGDGINNLRGKVGLDAADFGQLIDTSGMVGGDVAGVLANTKANISSAYQRATAIDYVTTAQNNLNSAINDADRLQQGALSSAVSVDAAIQNQGAAVGQLVDAYNKLGNAAAIDPSKMLRPQKDDDKSKAEDPLEKIRLEIQAELDLKYVQEDRYRVIKALGKDANNYSEQQVQSVVNLAEASRLANEQLQKMQGLSDSIASSMASGFMSIVDGTKTAKDAFRDMARDIIKQLYNVLVVQQLVGSFDAKTKTGTGLAGMIIGAFQANGGAWSGGSQIQAYANGGVVGGPTTFPMAGGKTGLMGEAGPEAIMPLKRGANGKLGVQMEGGGGDTIVVNQSFNFQANGDDSVKRIIAQAAPQIAQMTKKSMIDDRRRGGQMKATFG